MKNIKSYSRQYEKVFTDRQRIDKSCRMDKVSILDNTPSIDNYVKQLKDTISSYEKTLFDHLVKVAWLVYRFCYFGKRRRYLGKNGMILDRAFGLFMHNYVGYSSKFVFSYNGPHPRIVSYFYDFFPNFLDGNPFEQEHKYPYQYMNLECLCLVYQLDERLELLQQGEEKKMGYSEFKDHVLNYINCYNEEHGKTYDYKFWAPDYIKNLKSSKKYEGRQT